MSPSVAVRLHPQQCDESGERLFLFLSAVLHSQQNFKQSCFHTVSTLHQWESQFVEEAGGTRGECLTAGRSGWRGSDTGCMWKQRQQKLSGRSDDCIRVNWESDWGLIDHQSHYQFITEVVMTLISKQARSITGDWLMMKKYKDSSINEGCFKTSDPWELDGNAAARLKSLILVTLSTNLLQETST